MTSATTRVPADLAALGKVHGALAAALASEGWIGEPASRVLTASTEALANAVEHGSAPGAGIDVDVEVSGRAARVRILDGGRPAAPRRWASPRRRRSPASADAAA